MEDLSALGERYGTWWIDFLGEHNHVGGESSISWLLDRVALSPSARLIDCGAFVGALARTVARRVQAAVAADVNGEFLAVGRALPAGDEAIGQLQPTISFVGLQAPEQVPPVRPREEHIEHDAVCRRSLRQRVVPGFDSGAARVHTRG